MPTRTAQVLADRDAYLEAVRAANVLAPNQLQKAILTPGRSAAELASALVAADLLTRFQADRLLSGRTEGFVLGPHVILEQVGRGAMSRVYKARHRTMNRLVAIKVLAAELTRTAAARQQFQENVRAAGALSHPNVVTAYDANELHDRFYLVLEFVDGPSLEALVRQRGPLPIEDACEIVRQIAHGLNHAHGHGMTHRDLDPGNVLIARPTSAGPPAVKIAGFGLPRVVAGAPDYRAPEALHNPYAATPQADLYSLGCVFYFLLTGHAPFTGTAEELARAHASEEAPRVNSIRHDVRPEMAAIVHRLLAKHSTGRFRSAAELLAHLDAACVPVAIPMECVNFDLPAGLPYAHDSGYLTGRHAAPDGSGGHAAPLPFVRPEVEAEPSPWAQLTEPTAADTAPLERSDNTPAPPPHRTIKLTPRRRTASTPPWLAAVLVSCVAVLSLISLGVMAKLLTK